MKSNQTLESHESNMKDPKLLLMGNAGVGKTSMRSIIFANLAPKETFGIGYTHSINESRLKII